MRSQALGLAERLDLPFIEKRIAIRDGWRRASAWFRPPSLALLDSAGDRLEPPWPRLLIACGRRSIGPALAVKQLSGGTTKLVYIQDPRRSAEKFDLVVPMRHDPNRGPNVLPVETALHRMTPQRLREAAAEWAGRLKPPGRMLLGVLVGGPTRRQGFGPAEAARLLELAGSAAERGFFIALATSRRTPPDIAALLSDRLAGEGWGQEFGRDEPSLVPGILALADRLVVTADSVSMISEALAAGSPVHVLPLGRPSRRHGSFLDALRDRGLVSMAAGTSLDWTFQSPGPVDATPAVAAEVRRRLLGPKG